jgi:hypothetical protein
MNWSPAAIHTVRGNLVEADSYYNRALPVLQRSGPMPIAFGASGIRCMVHQWRSEHTELEDLLAWMRPIAEIIGGSTSLIFFRFVSAMGFGNQGRISRALSEFQEMYRLAELNGSQFYLPRVRLASMIYDLETGA